MQEEEEEKRNRKKGIGEWKRTGRTMRWKKARYRYHGNAPCELFFKLHFGRKSIASPTVQWQRQILFLPEDVFLVGTGSR